MAKWFTKKASKLIRNPWFIGSSSLVTIAAVALPVSLTLELAHGQSTSIKAVKYDNQTFTSSEALLDYIKHHAVTDQTTSIDRTYLVFEGDNEKEFDDFEKAIDYIANKYVKKEIVYPKNLLDWQTDSATSEVGAEQFQTTDQSPIYNIYRKSDDSYTFALKDDAQGNENARIEAAKTYLQVHNAFLYDNHYFESKDSIEKYIRKNQNSVQQVLDQYKTKVKFLRFGNGAVKTFSTFDDVKDLIANNAQPYYDAGNGQIIPIDQDHIADLATAFDSSALKYVPIAANDGQVLQVVDMDTSTPNGSFYGPYLFKSGLGVDGIQDVSNWSVTTQTDLQVYKESLNEQMLFGFMDYILAVNNVGGPWDLINNVCLEGSNTTLSKYLQTLGSKVNYNVLMTQFLNNLSRGVRFNTLNAVIMARSFIIDKMVQNSESVDSILQVSKYFDSISQILDDFASVALAPIFVGDKSNIENFHINYFQNSLNFYDSKTNNGVSFQNDPNSYLRRLIGYDSKYKATDDQNNASVFSVIKAFMGSTATFLKEAKNINDQFEARNKSIKSGIFSMKTKGTSWFEDLPLTSNHDDQTWLSLGNKLYLPFSISNATLFNFNYTPKQLFAGKSADVSSDEYKNIWSNLSNGKVATITYTVGSNKTIQTIDSENLQNNYSLFLTENRNRTMEKFVDDLNVLSKKIDDEIKKPENGNMSKSEIIANRFNFWKSKEGLQALKFNAMDYLSESAHIADVKLPESATERVARVNKAVDALIPDLASRLSTFNDKFISPVSSLPDTVASIFNTAKQTFDKATGKEEKDKKKAEEAKKKEAEEQEKMEKDKQNAKTDDKSKEDSSAPDPYKDDEDIYYTIDDEDINAAPETINRDTSDSSALGTLNKINKVVKQLSGITDLISGAFPIVGGVIKAFTVISDLINNFNSSTTTVYNYLTNDGTAFYWDGARTDSSWWGLVVDNTYTINNLKLVANDVIISGYSSNQQGIYYDGHFYKDTIDVRKMQAQALVKSVLAINKNDSEGLNKKFDKVIWKVNLNNVPAAANIKSDSINSLLTTLESLCNNIAEEDQQVFSLVDNTITTSINDALNKAIKSILDNIQKVLILRKPDLAVDGTPIIGYFDLPLPSYGPAGERIIPDAKTQPTQYASYLKQNAKYVVYNPNVSNDWLSVQGQSAQADKDELSFFNVIKTESDVTVLKRLITQYAKAIYVQTKQVILPQILDVSNARFDDIATYDFQDNARQIYTFVNYEGQERYFTNVSDVIKLLINRNNLNFTIHDNNRKVSALLFDGHQFTTIEQIYDYVINNYTIDKGGEHV